MKQIMLRFSRKFKWKVYINWIHYSLSEGTLVKKQKGWRSKGTYRKLHCWYARPSLLILYICDLFFVFILVNRSDWIWSWQCTDIMICLFVFFFTKLFFRWDEQISWFRDVSKITCSFVGKSGCLLWGFWMINDCCR